jgi:hypothetical protein
MIGPAIIVVVLLVVIPVGVLMTGAVVAAALGWFLRDNGEATHEGSELVDLNR